MFSYSLADFILWSISTEVFFEEDSSQNDESNQEQGNNQSKTST